MIPHINKIRHFQVSVTPQCRLATRFRSQQLYTTFLHGIPSVPTQQEQSTFLLLSNTTEFIGLIIWSTGHLWHLIHNFAAEADCWASKERISVFQYSHSTLWKLDAHDWAAHLHELFLPRQPLSHMFSTKSSSKNNFAVLPRIWTGLSLISQLPTEPAVEGWGPCLLLVWLKSSTSWISPFKKSGECFLGLLCKNWWSK